MTNTLELTCEVCLEYFTEEELTRHYIFVHDYDVEVAYDTVSFQAEKASRYDEWDLADREYDRYKEEF